MGIELIETINFRAPKVDKSALDAFSDSQHQKEGKTNLPKALIVTIDASHSGYVNKNKVLYTQDGMKKSVGSMVSNFVKPVLKNHDPNSEPLGRVISSEFMESRLCADKKVQIVNSDGYVIEELEVAEFVQEEKLEYPPDVIVGSRIPTGFMQVRTRITDGDAIEKLLDGRYHTVSIRGTGENVKCSIPWCKQNIGTDGLCAHTRGKVYSDDEKKQRAEAYWVVDGVEYKEISFVNIPGDSFAGVRKIEVIVDGKPVEHQVPQPQDADATGISDRYETAAAEFFYQVGTGIQQLQDAREKEHMDKPETQPQALAFAESVQMTDTELQAAVDGNKFAEGKDMEDAKLSYAARQKLPDSAFCGPDRSFPAHDAAHVRNGLARLSQSSLSADQKAKVKACLSRRAKKHGIKVGKDAEDYSTSDITLAEASIEDIKDLEVFETWLAEYAKEHQSERTETLLVALARAEKENKEIKEASDGLKTQVSELDERVKALTDNNTDMAAKVHKDLAISVVEKKISVKAPDVSKYFDTEEAKQKTFKDELIAEHQKRTTESLKDTLKDLELISTAAPEPVKATEIVENPGLVVADSQQTSAGIAKRVEPVAGEKVSRSDEINSLFGIKPKK